MGLVDGYSTLQVRSQGSICFVKLDRPAANNTIDGQLVTELGDVLARCEESASVVVLSGSTEVFCFGADFSALARGSDGVAAHHEWPAALYDLWLKLATGPYISIAHVQGKANAGGIGFVAASDVVLAQESAQFSLSELLFGLYPACVLPFLLRRIGFQKSHYLTLTTQPISAARACEWGLVDAVDPNSEELLRRHLVRIGRLSKAAIRRYKGYMGVLGAPLAQQKPAAVAANLEAFSDPLNRQAIMRYVEHGVFPWEKA